MEIVVDGSSGWGAARPDQSLGSVFEEVRKRVSAKKRSVTAFILDGEDLSQERQNELSAKAVSEHGLLEVKTVDPLGVSLSALSGLVTYLGILEKLHDEGTALVKSNELGKAGEKLAQCLDGWDVLVRGIRDVASLSGADLRVMTAGIETVETRMRKLQQVLLKFRMAFDMRDLVRVAEVVERELRPLLKDWRGVLESLSTHVARQAGLAK